MSESSSPLFPLQTSTAHPRLEREQAAFVQHEVLFEDRFTQLQDQRVFIGQGISRNRLRVAGAIAIILLSALLGRVGWMQFGLGETYRAQADANRFRLEVLPARRGLVRDRNDEILAENISTFHVQMRLSDLPRDTQARTQAVAVVARTIGQTADEILTHLNATGTAVDEWVTVTRDLSYERAIALSLRLPEISGVSLVMAAKRRYPWSKDVPSLSHLLGYVGAISREDLAEFRSLGYRSTDEIGKTGIERSLEAVLRGNPGERLVEVDAMGRPRAVLTDRAPQDGRDIGLTIDLKLQAQTEAALQRGLRQAGVKRGSAVVMDPRDGSILAIVSEPGFDNNLFAGRVSSTIYQALLDNPDRPLFPRAWAGQYPSGSTIKPMIALSALAEGIISPHTTVNSTGGIRVGPWFFPDWAESGHGQTNVRKAIAWSVNTFFYTVGGGHESFLGLGVNRLTAWMQRFGLGERTGFDLPGEASGFVPSQSWKEQTKGERWYIGDTYNLSIGQGDLLVTPLQLARTTATLANGGRLVSPHLARHTESPAELMASIEAVPEAWSIVQAGMRDTVVYGSARQLANLPFSAAGKTGTAEWRKDRPHHAWFAGYAPANKPEVVVIVLIEEGGEGATAAVPVAGEILRSWARLKSQPAGR